MVIITTVNDRPKPKDFMTVVITVSTVLLALTPVFLFLAIQQTYPADLPLPSIALYAILTFSFISGLVTIGVAVEWFDKPTARRKPLAKGFLICQTATFTFGSFTLLSFTLLFN